jgi:hypothetical protein
MTPRTTAFTQLNGMPPTPGFRPGMQRQDSAGSGYGRPLALREQFGQVMYGEVRVPDPI